MRLLTEQSARFFVLALVFGLLLSLSMFRWWEQRGVIEVHAAMPEGGGWSPSDLTIAVGEPLHLRLVSDDVLHGFAIGQRDRPALELKPGQPVETTLVFDRPGKYVFYCTRWCGPNHWRMRGTIEVSGPSSEKETQPPPLYVTLGLDIDAEHLAEVLPANRPSAARGKALQADLPRKYLSTAYYQQHSPAQVWQALREEPGLAYLHERQIWDLVAYLWARQATPEDLAAGARLYAENCAACHGETGQGDGVMAERLAAEGDSHDKDTGSGEHADIDEHGTTAPTDFTDAEHLLGASPAVLHGKIVRGGMGTGMPYWGPIFTDEQVWVIVNYLWTFQLEVEEQ